MAELRLDPVQRKIVNHLASGGVVHEGKWDKNKSPVPGTPENRDVHRSYYDGQQIATLPLRVEEVKRHLDGLLKEGKLEQVPVEGREMKAFGFKNAIRLASGWKPKVSK